MLRAFEVCNMIRFQERYIIPEDVFGQEAYVHEPFPALFIGENNTGKSAVCELIRRCCSDSISLSQSTVCHKDKIGYAVCKFEIDKEVTDNVLAKLSNDIRDKLATIDNILSLYIVHHTNGNPTDSSKNEFIGHIYKIMLIKTKKEYIVIARSFHQTSCQKHIVHTYRHITKKDGDNSTSHNTDKVKLLTDALFNSRSDSLPTCIMDFVKSVTNGNEGHDKNQYTVSPLIQTDFDLLYDHLLSESILFLFSHRGIGNLDSSLSVHMRLGEINYTAANEKAETFRELFHRAKKRNEGEVGSVQDFNNTLKQILGNSKCEFFVQESDEIFYKAGEGVIEIPLLKTPEGIYEAGIISLLVNDPDIKTLILEEPNKAMHPPMIERLFSKLSEKCTDKSICVVTHSPDFIKWSARQKVLLFRRYKEDNNLFFSIKRIFETEDIGKNILGLTFEKWKRIFFSRLVLLVEGPTDERFIKSVIRYHCNQLNWNLAAFDLSAISVISVDSCTRIAAVEEMCKWAAIPCRAIMDADVLYKDNVWKDMPERLLIRLRDKQINDAEKVIKKIMDFNLVSHIAQYKSKPEGTIQTYLETKFAKHVNKNTELQRADIKDFLQENHSEVFKRIKEWDPAVPKSSTSVGMRSAKWAQKNSGKKQSIKNGTMSERAAREITKVMEDVSFRRRAKPPLLSVKEAREEIIQAAQEQNYFIWRIGNLEDMINDNLQETFFLKEEWDAYNEDDVEKLTKNLYPSKEIQDLCKYLEEFCSSSS